MASNEPFREQTLEGKLLLWAADWLTTLLLTAGLILPCLSAYGFSDQYGFDLGAVLFFCVFGALGASALLTWRHGAWAALALAAGDGSILWRLWKHVTEDWLLGRPPWLPDLIDQYPGTLYLLYALAVLLLAWTVVRARKWWLAAALATLPVLPAILSGVLPSWWAMLAGFAGWGSMLLTGLFDRRDQESLARAGLLSLGGMTALILLLIICLPMEGYLRPAWATNARASLIRGMNRQLEKIFTPEELENNFLSQLGLDLSVEGEGGPGNTDGSGLGGADDAANTGMNPREDLLSVGPRRYAGLMFLRISTNQPDPAGRIYLRSTSFGVYTGTSWEGAAGGEQFHPEQYPLLTAPDQPVYSMSIRDVTFSGAWYYPYRYSGAVPLDGNGRLTLEQDALEQGPAMTAGAYGDEYRISYCPGGPEDGFTPLTGSAAAEMESYRSSSAFSENYLSVPGTLRGTLLPRMDALQQMPAAVDERLPEQFRRTVAAAAQTAAYLASVAVYDPNTPAMEAGEDFVAHFLEEGRGFCVHFATAGAMLLRMQGIPALYVNGYVATLDQQGRGAVQDSDAHAWVEIYLDGYGWYPVEMTPGYAGGVSGAGLEGASGTQDETPSDDPEDPEEETTAEEEEASEEEETRDEDSPGDQSTEEETLPEAEDEAEGLAFPWKVLFGIAVFWAVFCAAYLLALLTRDRARKAKDTNRSVLNAYGRYERLRRWGCGEDEELVRLAKKAKFSQHTLTAEERNTAWKCLDEDVKQSRVGQPVRRRWLLAVLCPLF